MENDNNLQLLLFDTIVINNSEDLEKLINEISDEQKIYMFKLGIQKAYTQGVYSLPESEILSKCMRSI